MYAAAARGAWGHARCEGTQSAVTTAEHA